MGDCKSVQTPATPYLSLVMSRGKRFESARRLSFLPAKSVKTESLRHLRQGLVSNTSAIDAIPRLHPCRQQRAFPSRVSSASSGLGGSWQPRPCSCPYPPTTQ